jgi:hypothetical protein
VKFAYADPPYLGCGARLYGKHHQEAAVWDDPETHRALVGRLCDEYPDGWAMSLHVPSLRVILPMCPEGARVGAYCKTFAQIRPTRVQWFWEPVIWMGGRTKAENKDHYRDWCQAWPRNGSKDGLIGGKPRDFCRWVFGLLGARKGDTLDDIFPGTGAVSAAWAEVIGGPSPLPPLPLELSPTETQEPGK